MLAMLGAAAGAHAQQQEGNRARDPDIWRGPFGGSYSAYVTVATDYSSAGISNSNRNPVGQIELDYRTPDLFSQLPVWAYVNLFVTNVDFPSLSPGTPAPGAGIEFQLLAGFKVKPIRQLRLDIGYVQHAFPGYTAELALDYGEWNIDLDYDFGWAEIAGRVRYSPNAFGFAGVSWNKRGLVSVPLPFIRINDEIKFKAIGSLGHVFIEDPILSNYWYWQVGLVASAYGLDFHIAYTATSISRQDCLDTANCDGRFFASITKTF